MTANIPIDLSGPMCIVRGLRASDTMLMTGSVPSGLASSCAAMDLLLVGPGRRRNGLAASVSGMRTATYEVASGPRIRVTHVTDDELDGHVETINWFEEALLEPAVWANRPYLDMAAQVLLHDLRSGVVLANESIAQFWRERLRLDRLPVYLIAVRIARYQARRNNVEWALKDGDTELAMWTMLECLEELMCAVLCSVGETNPRKRWHPRLLRLHEAEIGRANVDRFVELLTVNRTSADLALPFAEQMREELLRRCRDLAHQMDSVQIGSW